MDPSRGFVLHSAEWSGEGSLVIDETLSLTASLDVLRALAEGGGPTRALLGASGMRAGRPGSSSARWRRTPGSRRRATEAIVFDRAHETKWRRALHSLRIDPIMLSAVAGLRLSEHRLPFRTAAGDRRSISRPRERDRSFRVGQGDTNMRNVISRLGDGTRSSRG